MVKIYGSYGGLFVFMLLDDYGECVKKKEFLQTPFCCAECDVRWCGTARAGERRYITSEGGEGGPNWRRCRLVCKVRDRCCL
jgi:hypothetical protein